MTAQPHPFRHEPPDRGALWARLRLTGGQLAALCGVSLRQVDYWTRHGHLPVAPGDAPRYDGRAAELCLLIGRAHRRGLPLPRAVTLARATLASVAPSTSATPDHPGDGNHPSPNPSKRSKPRSRRPQPPFPGRAFSVFGAGVTHSVTWTPDAAVAPAEAAMSASDSVIPSRHATTIAAAAAQHELSVCCG